MILLELLDARALARPAAPQQLARREHDHRDVRAREREALLAREQRVMAAAARGVEDDVVKGERRAAQPLEGAERGDRRRIRSQTG